MREFTIRDQVYRLRPIDARKGLTLFKKGALLYHGFAQGDELQHWFPMLSQLSEEDLTILEQVIVPLIDRQIEGKKFTKIYEERTHTYLFQDIESYDLLFFIKEGLFAVLPDFMKLVLPRDLDLEAETE